MSVEISPLSDAVGAEIRGLDLTRPIAKPDLDAVKAAFLDRHLLCFRSPPLDAGAYVALARHFGTPKRQLLRRQHHRQCSEISVLDSSYACAADKPEDARRVRLSGWHTDDSYFEKPAKATMLQSLALPESGGETRFCNTRRAYEELPGEMKERLEGLRAVHSYDTDRAPAAAAERTAQEIAETPDVMHPLVRTHEDTGLRAIYFNSNRTDCVVGLERGESDALLDAIHDHMTQPKYRYDHAWRLGDILLWDNRCVIHSVNVDYPVGQTRRHQRILLDGPRPV